MLSKLKSGVAPPGERRVTRQMTATALDSRNPLHIPEMLENVLKYLPVDDLKSCRLVNSLWKDAALKPMRKISAQITFRDYEGCNGLKDMERFLKCFTVTNSSATGSESTGEDREFQVGIPCTKFQLYMDIISEQSSEREKLIVVNFLQTISLSVTEIVLNNKNLDHFLKGLVEELQFPCLRKATFDWIAGRNDTETVTFNHWMSAFINTAPRLERISFFAHPTKVWSTRDPSIPFFLDVLQENRGMNIKELIIDAELDNEDFLKLSSSGLKLNCLCFGVDNSWQKEQIKNAFYEFLETQCDSLKRLMIFSPLHDVSFSLPRLKNLNVLSYQGCSTGVFNYRAQLPALKVLILHGVHQSNWLRYLDPEMKPTENVMYLSFDLMDPGVEAIFEAARIFPRVIRLKMSAFPLGLPIVYKSWRNLKELTLCTREGSCIDRLLTGLNEDGYKEALRRMRNWTPNFDESGIRIGFHHRPISVLRHLKVLRLDVREQHGTQLEITKVSICLALMKMQSLRILDFGARLRSPELSIPNRVLKEFRKNRLILWKLKHAPLTSRVS